MSFLFFTSTVSEVETHILNMKNKKNPIQPFLIVIGESLLKSSQFLIYFDNIKYKFKTFLKALDTCFKIFFVFNLDYPPNSKAVWIFIQFFFYKISTNINIFPDVKVLINQITEKHIL